MSAEAGGAGEAGEAAVETTEVPAEVAADTGAISAEELAQRQADDQQALADNVTNAEAKVAKFQAHLDAANEALAAATAELEGN